MRNLAPPLLLLILGSLAPLGACDGRRPAPAARKDARVAAAPDARPGPAPPPVASTSLTRACACAAVPPGPDARPGALVERLDGLNQGLRGLLATLDAAVPDEAKAALGAADRTRITREAGRLGCLVDCVLHQFPDVTEIEWGHLQAVAALLDRVPPTLERLAQPPAQRPAGPDLGGLADRFNSAARAANRSIGVPLLEPPVPPAAVLTLDLLSFRRRIDLWARKVEDLLGPGAGEIAPCAAPADLQRSIAEQAVTARVTATRRTRALQALLVEASALACRTGDPCAPVVDLFRASQTALRPVIEALHALAADLRESAPEAAAPARAADLAGRLVKACQGWRAARSAVARPTP